jgi:hypothetical protein
MQAEDAAECHCRDRTVESLTMRAIYPELLRIAGIHSHRDPLGRFWSPDVPPAGFWVPAASCSAETLASISSISMAFAG